MRGRIRQYVVSSYGKSSSTAEALRASRNTLNKRYKFERSGCTAHTCAQERQSIWSPCIRHQAALKKGIERGGSRLPGRANASREDFAGNERYRREESCAVYIVLHQRDNAVVRIWIGISRSTSVWLPKGGRQTELEASYLAATIRKRIEKHHVCKTNSNRPGPRVFW